MSDEEFRLINFSLDNILDTLRASRLTDRQWDALVHKFRMALKLADGYDYG